MKRVSLLLLFALAFAGISFGQLGTASVTYTNGDIPSDKYFTYYSGTESSMCPGLMTVSIPVDAVILSTDVSYDMTSDENPGSYMARQRSHLRCVSPGGMHEATMTNGPSVYTPGTYSYSRTGLTIANGVVGGGDINFELHAGSTNYRHHCSTDTTKVDNNTWTITITYIPAGLPSQAFSPNPVVGGLYVGLDDDLTWDFGDDTESYDVYFGTDNPPATKFVDNAVAGTSGTFDPGTMDVTTTYYWQVVSRNANGYTEGPVWSFTTVCGPFETPFFEDFEGLVIPELPYCWSKIVTSTSASAKVQSYAYNGHNAPYSLQFYNANDPAATLLFISPQIEVGAGSLADKMVNLHAIGENYPYLQVGTMSDPTDASTFTLYKSVLVWADNREFDIYLNDYTGTDTYIAFKLGCSVNYQAAYLDEITIGDMPTCIRPSGLSADNLTINSATLSWTDANGATSWNIEYGEAGFTPSGTPTISGVTNPYELTGLTSATEYDYYVQADCGGGDVSAWSMPGSFQTPCDFYEVPFSEDFNDVGFGEMPDCWSSILLCADAFAMNGVQGGYFQMQNSNDINSTLMLISPPIADLAPNRIRFDAQSNKANYDLIIGTMSNPADQNSFEALTSVTVTSAYTYEEFDVWLNGYTGTNQYFVIKHSNGISQLTFQVDNISIEALPSCLEPVDLFVNDITKTTANFNWTESGTAEDWEIEVGSTGFEPGTGNFIQEYSYNEPGATNLVFPLAGLTSSTPYEVYVRANCGDGDYSVWSGPAKFLTSFDTFASLPVTEDFENGLGITGNNFANTVDWTLNTDLQVSGLNSVKNAYTYSSDNVLFILGTFDFTAKENVMLSFWQIAKTDGNNDHCYVEISTDGGLTYDQLPESTYEGAGWYREAGQYGAEGPAFDEDSYPAWGTGNQIPDNTFWRKEYFNLTDYNTFDNVVIRFRLVSDAYTNRAGWYIDDIAVEALGASSFYTDPTTITEDVTVNMPVAMIDMTMGNAGTLPTAYTANVIYDEVNLLTENFNAGIPDDWTIVHNGTNNVTWADTTGKYGYSFDGTRFAWADGYQNYVAAGVQMNEQLITPAVDASAYVGGALQLEYDHAFDADYNPGDTARVFVYDGSEWVKIYERWLDDGYLTNTAHGIHKVFNVSMYANANFQVKFQYVEASATSRGQYFAIDNFRLRASMSALGWLKMNGAETVSGVALPDADGFPGLVNVTLNGTGLPLGSYNANIEVTTNEPGKSLIVIPVTMNVVPPAPPTAFTATADLSTITLAYNLNDAGDDVIIATNSTDSFDQPEDGMAYPEGSTIGSNGTVIYQGSMTEFDHTGLDPNTTFYYKAWSVDAGNNYSEDGVAANASTGDYQLVCVPAGWSSISSYKVPQEAAMESVLSEVANEMTILLSNTGIYWPSHSINTIGNWDSYKGYKTKMNEAACFHIVGEMTMDKTINVSKGASYIPVLCDQAVVATDIFSQFGNDLEFAYDLQTQSIYWPEGGIATLEYLEPGVGYLVIMYQAGQATYACDDQPKLNYAKAQPKVFKNAPWDYQQSGVQHFISINKSAFAELEKGDFIGVFNAQNECAGLVQYNGEEGNLFLVVNGDDITTDALDGFTEGENMSFRIYSPSQMSETEVAVEFATSMPNAGSFADNGRSMILKIGAGAAAIQENIQSSISIYPNPATDMVNISLNGDYSEATVVVYNPEGRAVINQVFNGQTEMNVSSLEPGFYFVRISTSTINEVRKLVIR